MEKKTIVTRVEVLPGKNKHFYRRRQTPPDEQTRKRGEIRYNYIKTRHNP